MRDPETDAAPEDKQLKQKSGLLGGLLRFILLMIVLAAAAAAYGLFGPGPAHQAQVIVPRGAGLQQIAADLQAQNVIYRKELLVLAALARQDAHRLKAGEYEIPSQASVWQVLDVLVAGTVVGRTITIAEGLSVKQITALLLAEEALSGEIDPPPPEGSLLPETYQFTWGDSRQSIIERMQRAMDTALDELWAVRQRGLPLAGRQDALILASIVEKETAMAAERQRVAAVFINRLKRGMKLDSDPTIIYGLTLGTPLGRGLRRSELAKDTPYNTYIHGGLPPTPITNPGRGAIAAVLNPSQTKELYFVADGTGGHAFAETYREHQRNVRRWRQIERQQN